jgi:hypothetical protein
MKVMNLVPYNSQLPGRISHELQNNRQGVVLRIFEEIMRSAVVMGISVEAKSAKMNTVEAIDKIKEVYPTAHIEDIAEAIKMGAFGQIKLDNQLHTLSASNIFQWYREFRANHQDKMKSPPPPPAPYQEFEVTEEMKNAIMRKSFYRFISEPQECDHMIELYYDKLSSWDVLNASTEVKNEAYQSEVFKLINNVPLELMQNKVSRTQVREFQKYYDEREDKTKMDFTFWKENPLHKRAVWASKRKIIMDFLKTADKEKLMDKFDEKHGTRGSDTLS